MRRSPSAAGAAPFSYVAAWTAPTAFAPALAAMLIALASPHSASAATLEVGAGKKYTQPSAAIAAAAAGDTVLIAEGTYFDCAQLFLSNITIAGSGSAEKTILTDRTCGGKAILVIGGDDVTIKNLTLQRARVPDGNGAGIRAEGGNLTVDGVRFINNQNGILSAGNPQANYVIRNSVFIKNGTCNGACAHGIYIGQSASLKVENSQFSLTREGHHIKSRALHTEVTGCTIEDGAEGTASYMIEAPNGGSLIVRGNHMVRGPNAGNHNAISIGGEGVSQPTDEITIENNTFENDGNFRATFVNNGSATEARVHGNSFKGATNPLNGDGTVD